MTKVLERVINVFLVSWSWALFLHTWTKLIRARWDLSNNILSLPPNAVTTQSFSKALGSLVYFALSAIELRQFLIFFKPDCKQYEKALLWHPHIQSCYDFKLCLVLLYCQAMYTFWAAVQVTSTLFPKTFLAAGKCLRRSLKV